VDERSLAVVSGNEHVPAEQGGDGGEFARLPAVVAFQRGIQVGGEVPSLGPGVPVGQYDDATAQQEDEAGWGALRAVERALEQPGGESLSGLVGLAAAHVRRMQREPGPCLVKGGVVAVGPSAFEGEQVSVTPGDLHLMFPSPAVNGHLLLRVTGETERLQYPAVPVGKPLTPY